MKTEHRILIFFALCIIFIFILFQVFRNFSIKEDISTKNEYCISLGNNLTLNLQDNQSYVTGCECYFDNIISRDMEALCICTCYTDGTVCPKIDNYGRCFFSVFLSELNEDI